MPQLAGICQLLDALITLTFVTIAHTKTHTINEIDSRLRGNDGLFKQAKECELIADSSFDKVLSQLQIWQPNSDGSQSLTAIAKLGIGAIYSRGIDAPFDYKTADNQLQGQLKQAGVFLFEDGRAGSVQQIDLAV